MLTHLNQGNFTPAPSPFPPHVVSLAEALRPIHTKLKTEQNPFLVTVSISDLDELIRELEEHLEIIEDFALRVVDKIHVLKQEVLLNPDISERDLYRSVGRFEEVIYKFLNECSRASRLPAYRMDTKGRDLIIEIYRYILSEIRDWLEDFIETVSDPRSAYEKRGLSMSDDITFTFVFELGEPSQFKELNQWLTRKTTAYTRKVSRPRARLPVDKSGRNGITPVMSFTTLTSILKTLKALTKKALRIKEE